MENASLWHRPRGQHRGIASLWCGAPTVAPLCSPDYPVRRPARGRLSDRGLSLQRLSDEVADRELTPVTSASGRSASKHSCGREACDGPLSAAGLQSAQEAQAISRARARGDCRWLGVTLVGCVLGLADAMPLVAVEPLAAGIDMRGDLLDAEVRAAPLGDVLRAVAEKAGFEIETRGDLGEVRAQRFRRRAARPGDPAAGRREPGQPDHALRGGRAWREAPRARHRSRRRRGTGNVLRAAAHAYGTEPHSDTAAAPAAPDAMSPEELGLDDRGCGRGVEESSVLNFSGPTFSASNDTETFLRRKVITLSGDRRARTFCRPWT